MNKWAQQVDEIRRLWLYRQPVVYLPLSATIAEQAGKKYLMLASNSYLGLTHHPAVRQAAIEAVQAYGAGSGGARLTTGTHPLYPALEKDLAAFKQREAALVFNTGYMTNVGVISGLARAGDVIFSDAWNHASIIDGCRLARSETVVYQHGDVEDLRQKLQQTPCSGKRFIITDGVFSMDGDIAPLDRIVPLAEEYDACVIVDDAHATGVIGPGGRGTAAYFGLKGRVQVEIGTLSKALAAEGGFAAGDESLIEILANRARSFIFSTALAPATVAAAHAALRQLIAEPEMVDRLRENAIYLRSKLAAAGFTALPGDTPIIPVILGREETALDMARALQERGVIVAAIRPPTVPPGSSRLRLTITAEHRQQDLDKAVVAMQEAWSSLKQGGNGV
ncbi:8-amino-7-oxononanoate synthase [Acetonema longum]|uniref:8-amino-7-ketopelargonate synthase n=1 Tax=Acetonema longum DSM 6540 TaxID=1009370 RepID=F7NJT4_9FIRM|nr:8-amino-7-oxononanoate synthase [Acetonema longum]EGO63697.1 8-amino-7-oxononanoate synthase [Acetonema longum DSM 6540]